MATRLEQLQKLAALEPDDPMSHYAIGLELVNQERWVEAIAAFDQAMTAERGDFPEWKLHHERCIVFTSLVRLDEAHAASVLATTLNPQDAESWCNGGLALLKTGDRVRIDLRQRTANILILDAEPKIAA